MFNIPSLLDLVQRARRSFRVNLPGSDAFLWPNNINPTAKVIAGLTHEVFGFADYIQRQKFALTADSENLDLHGEEFGLARRPTAPATGAVDIVSDAPVSISVGAQFRRSDDVIYLAVNGGSLAGAGTLNLDVIAAMDGQVSNAAAGTELEIVSGVADDFTGTLQGSVAGSGIAGGYDIEDDETFRSRILFRKRNPPHGGAPADYVTWAGEVSGVTFNPDRPTVFVERRWAGPGTVRVFPLMFGLYADGIPSAADIARVQQHIDTVSPATAAVTVAPPLPRPIDITILDLVPDRTDVREAVLTELRETFKRFGRVAGNDVDVGNMPYLAFPAAFSRSWIWQAVANASGEQRHSIQSPAADITLAAGEYPTLGIVSFAASA